MRSLLVASLFLVSAASCAQSRHVIRLERPSKGLDSLAIAVVDVHDLRAAPDSIGEVRTWGMLNLLKPAQLGREGAQAELLAFLQKAFPEREGARPISVGIDLIQVSEQIVFDTEYGRAEVALRFFAPQGDSLGLLGMGSGFEELSRKGDVTRLHGGNLSRAIEAAVLAASADGVFRREPDTFTTVPALRALAVDRGAQSLRDVLAAEGDTAAVRSEVRSTAVAEGSVTARRSAELARASRSMRQYVVVGPVLGRSGTGGSLTAGVLDTAPSDWVLPRAFSAVFLSIDDPDRGVSGTFFYGGGALSAGKRLSPGGPVAQASGMVTFGSEEVEGVGSSFFLGGRMGVDLVHYPADKGLVVSGGVFAMRLFGSELYPSDVGVTAGVGFQF